MKIKQVVTTKFHSAYCSYNGIDFTDVFGNEQNIKMTDSEFLEFADMVNRKAERIKQEQLDEVREQLAKESEDE